MRDLVLAVLIGGGALASLARPWIGALLFVCISLMSPHVQFGYAAQNWPVATGVGLATLIGMLLTKNKQNPFVGAPVWALIAFNVWICVTLPFSMHFEESYPLWERSMKIFLMLYVTLALITDRRKLNWFVGVVVISIGYYGLKGGVFTLATGGNYRVWGPGGFIEGNNEVALATITIIPLLRYLQTQVRSRFVVHSIAVTMALCVITALGTYSRGALLGLTAMAGYFWWKSERKVVWGIGGLLVGLGALSLMPEQWWTRMDTIQSYESDTSALGRINAWLMAWNLARDNLFGGGFMIWTEPTFRRYAPNPADVHAAHSIYFQTLGEHGFIGLALFLSIGIFTFQTTERLVRISKRSFEYAWAGQLGAMVQVSMISYGVGGAFLSLAYYDLPYDVMAMAVLALRFVRHKQMSAAGRPGAGPGEGHPPATSRNVTQ